MKILIVDIGSYIHVDMMVTIIKLYGEDAVDDLYYKFKGKDIFNNDEFENIFRGQIGKAA